MKVALLVIANTKMDHDQTGMAAEALEVAELEDAAAEMIDIAELA